jgi:hypothetical protein
MIFGRTGLPEVFTSSIESDLSDFDTIDANSGRPELGGGGEGAFPLAIQLNLISSRFSGNN